MAAEGALAQDTFFHLTTAGRAGLVAVAAGLGIGSVFLARFAHKRLSLANALGRWPLHLAIALVIFWLFEWLSPQFFYFYFMQLFSFLKLQSVIQEPPTPWAMVELLSFTAATDTNGLSRYSAGVLGWVLIAQAVWFAYKNKGGTEMPPSKAI